MCARDLPDMYALFLHTYLSTHDLYSRVLHMYLNSIVDYCICNLLVLEQNDSTGVLGMCFCFVGKCGYKSYYRKVTSFCSGNLLMS